MIIVDVNMKMTDGQSTTGVLVVVVERVVEDLTISPSSGNKY